MFFSFFKKVLFGCASLAARERARKRAHATQQTPSQTAAREAQKPPPRLSPDSCFEKKKQRAGKKRFPFLCFFFFVCSTLSMACTGMAHEGLLPCAICVQRFGNKMILQLIPLIARCCVLQRNRKPSHPSRHVVGAVLNQKVERQKNVFLM